MKLTFELNLFFHSYPKILFLAEDLRLVSPKLFYHWPDLEKKKSKLSEEDPFEDRDRVNDNAAIDADAAEQFGHMRVSALKRAYDRTGIQIRKALSRIKIGKFGLCDNCGKFIDTDRLMILPETTLCVECEKRKEK